MIVGANPAAGRPGPVRLWDCGTCWADLQPVPGQWQWDRLDTLVAQATGPVLLVLGHPAAWSALRGPDGRQAPWLPAGANRPPVSSQAWKTYVAATALRYGKRIQAYQVWNEPADPAFWTGTWDQLATLTADARHILGVHAPHATVVSAPLILRPAGGFPGRARAYLRAVRKADIDVVALHAYPEVGRGPKRFGRMLDEAQSLLRAEGWRKPVWVTEVNYNVPHGPILPDDRAAQVWARTRRKAARRNIHRLYCYTAPSPVFGLQPRHIGGQ